MTEKILVLGASGMLGSAVFNVLSKHGGYAVTGTIRSESWRSFFPGVSADRLISGIDILNHDDSIQLFDTVKPDVIINCVGLVKQLDNAKDPLSVLPINSLLPHRLNRLAKLINARLIHISTDCVFDGAKGGYTEADDSNAIDLYGKSKYIGEVIDGDALTLRTSIIGHQLTRAHSLIDWFLAQRGVVNGYSQAFFSGLPTNELARVIAEYVIPNRSLKGLYHVASARIDKESLLKIVAERYGHNVEIVANSDLVIDRSLDARRFGKATGYEAPDWPHLVADMYRYREEMFEAGALQR